MLQLTFNPGLTLTGFRTTRPWRFCMTCEECELLTDIRDFTTLFYMMLRCKSSEWLHSSRQSDLGMWFAILGHLWFCYLQTMFHKNRLLKKASYLLIFMIWENKMYYCYICNLFLFAIRARDPMNDSLGNERVNYLINCAQERLLSHFFPLRPDCGLHFGGVGRRVLRIRKGWGDAKFYYRRFFWGWAVF